jgi:hypothetical protein
MSDDSSRKTVAIDTQSYFTHDRRHSNGMDSPHRRSLSTEEAAWTHHTTTGLTATWLFAWPF